MPVVSVILPCCNSQAWIAEAIESILNQTHKKIELIVVDDGSTDNTINIVESFADDSRLTLTKRQHCSGGPATPRNDGIKIATGDYLAFIDSDDVWHPQKLELQIQAMRKHRLSFSSSLCSRFREHTPTPQTLNHKDIEVQAKTHQQLLTKNWVVTSSALMSRELLGDITFEQSAEYIGVEDYVVWLYIHQRSDIRSGVLNAPLVFYRLRRDSISSSKVKMALKIYYLLSHYRIDGKPLGLKKYYFFTSYAITSIRTRLGLG